jgi:hypothetical protein
MKKFLAIFFSSFVPTHHIIQKTEFFLAKIFHPAMVMLELLQHAPILQKLTGIKEIIWITLSLIRLGKFFNTTVRERAANRHRNRKHALDEMDALSERDFKMMFRLSRSASS